MSAEKNEKRGDKMRQTGVLFVQLPPRLKLEFKLACTEAGISMNDAVTGMVRDIVEALKREKD